MDEWHIGLPMTQALRAVFTEISRDFSAFHANSHVRMALNRSKNTENLPFSTSGGHLFPHGALHLPGERLIQGWEASLPVSG
jgi:hypothetical protein